MPGPSSKLRANITHHDTQIAEALPAETIAAAVRSSEIARRALVDSMTDAQVLEALAKAGASKLIEQLKDT